MPATRHQIVINAKMDSTNTELVSGGTVNSPAVNAWKIVMNVQVQGLVTCAQLLIRKLEFQLLGNIPALFRANKENSSTIMTLARLAWMDVLNAQILLHVPSALPLMNIPMVPLV